MAYVYRDILFRHNSVLYINAFAVIPITRTFRIFPGTRLGLLCVPQNRFVPSALVLSPVRGSGSGVRSLLRSCEDVAQEELQNHILRIVFFVIHTVYGVCEVPAVP